MSKVNFISKPNADESINLAIVSKTDVDYDPEAVGEVIYEDQSFGMMEPPCHTACFKYISGDVLDETFGEFKFDEIRNSYDSIQFIDDLFNKLNHVFLYDDSSVPTLLPRNHENK